MVFRGQDLWRAAPIFKYGVWDVLPGLREGLALFVVYLGVDFAMSRGSAHEAAHAAAPGAGAGAGGHGAGHHAEPAHGHGGGHGAPAAAKLH